MGTMETRSRTRIRATNSPPRAVTEGGTQPVRDEFVDPPSSAIGLSRDGKVSSRSTSLEAGPRSACRSTVYSESVDVEHGPAQGAENEENREFTDTVYSDIVCISTPDVRPISTLAKLAALNTSKSPGPDVFHPRILYEIRQELVEPFEILFTTSLKSSTLPMDWRSANITAIYKKGSKKDP